MPWALAMAKSVTFEMRVVPMRTWRLVQLLPRFNDSRRMVPPTSTRAGLTGFLAGVARSVAHANVTINFLLPGSFDTRRLRSSMEAAAQRAGTDPETVAAQRQGAIPARRFGDPAEFGAACAFLCSAQAGYITGQSLLIDGGAYPGVL